MMLQKGIFKNSLFKYNPAQTKNAEIHSARWSDLPWTVEPVKVSATLESRPFEFKPRAQTVFHDSHFFLTVVATLLPKQVGGVIVYLIPSLCYGNGPSSISSCPSGPVIINSLPVHPVKSGKFQNLYKKKKRKIPFEVPEENQCDLCPHLQGMPLVMVAPHSLTLLGSRHPTPGLTDSCMLIYVPSANILQQQQQQPWFVFPFYSSVAGKGGWNI